MTELDRRVFTILGFLALIVCLVALIQVHLGPGKSEANSIVSPWSQAQAPPQSVSRNSVRIDLPQKAQVKNDLRTANAEAALR